MITFTAGIYNITLPNPILGDSEQLDIKTKFEFSMSRVVHSTKKTTPHSKLLLMFEELTRTKMLEFQTFLINARGTQCTYVDYNSDSRVGAILGDPFEFRYVGSNECGELYSINIEFEDIDS